MSLLSVGLTILRAPSWLSIRVSFTEVSVLEHILHRIFPPMKEGEGSPPPPEVQPTIEPFSFKIKTSVSATTSDHCEDLWQGHCNCRGRCRSLCDVRNGFVVDLVETAFQSEWIEAVEVFVPQIKGLSWCPVDHLGGSKLGCVGSLGDPAFPALLGEDTDLLSAHRILG